MLGSGLLVDPAARPPVQVALVELLNKPPPQPRVEQTINTSHGSLRLFRVISMHSFVRLSDQLYRRNWCYKKSTHGSSFRVTEKTFDRSATDVLGDSTGFRIM